MERQDGDILAVHTLGNQLLLEISIDNVLLLGQQGAVHRLGHQGGYCPTARTAWPQPLPAWPWPSDRPLPVPRKSLVLPQGAPRQTCRWLYRNGCRTVAPRHRL